MTKNPSYTETIKTLQQQLVKKEEENKELTEKLNKFKYVAEEISDGLWDWDLLKKKLLVNTSWKNTLGFGSNEKVKVDGLWESLLHPEDKERAINELNEFVSAKIPKYDCVFRLRHKNKSYRWIRSKAILKYNSEGIPYSISGVHIDVTEQKKALLAIDASKKKYKALFQNSMVAICRSKIDTGEISECNTQFLKLLRIETKENFSISNHYYNPEERVGIIEELMEKGKIHSKELRIKRADGKLLWVSFSSVLYLQENTIESILIDVTQNVEIQKIIKQNEVKYRILFENSLMGIVRENIATGEILDANQKFWEILVEKNKEGKKTIDYYTKSTDRQILMNSKKGDRIENVELEMVRADGKHIWVLISTRLQVENNLAESVFVDITQSKLNTIELQKVNFELDSFVYHSSHDLRSPLRSILGLVNIYRCEKNEYLKGQCIDRIEYSINKLDRLVHELLSISRNDRINDPFVDINFMVEVDHSVDNFYSSLNTSNLSLEKKIKQSVKFVSDLTRIKIILNNIISNAIKYRDTNKELSRIIIDIEVNMQEAVIKVIDNGEGISSDQIPRIFDMFHRSSDRSDGSGLGLYIVKNIVKKLNAQISVASEPDVETVFTVAIPNALANK